MTGEVRNDICAEGSIMLVMAVLQIGEFIIDSSFLTLIDDCSSGHVNVVMYGQWNAQHGNATRRL